MTKVIRKKFDGVTRAWGFEIGSRLEFEVPDDRAELFKQLGYEVITEGAKGVDKTTKDKTK